MDNSKAILYPLSSMDPFGDICLQSSLINLIHYPFLVDLNSLSYTLPLMASFLSILVIHEPVLL
jgi:hypothetical protein